MWGLSHTEREERRDDTRTSGIKQGPFPDRLANGPKHAVSLRQ